MADPTHSTSRRALFAAPVALAAAATPVAAAPHISVPDVVAQDGALAPHAARIGELIRESRRVDAAITAQRVRGNQAHQLCLRWDALTDDILEAVPAALAIKPRTVADVVVQLVLVLDQVHEAEHDPEALDPLERAATALRRAIDLLAPGSGVDLRGMEAGYFDHEICVALEAGSALA